MTFRREFNALLTMIMLVAMAVMGNILLTAFYFESRAFASFDFFVALGFLIAEPCLLSIWCALGSEKGLIRIPISMGILLLLVAIYVKTMEVLDESIPLEVVAILFAIAFATTIVIQIPLWIFRGVTKQLIQFPSDSNPELQVNQFGIKHLLIATTVSAVMVAIARVSFPESSFGGFGIPWIELGCLLLFFIVVAGLLTFLALAVVFSQNRRWLFLTLLLTSLLFFPYASFHYLNNSSMFPGGMSSTEMMNMYIFIFSIVAAVIAVLSTFYRIGYRLLKRTGTSTS